MKTKKPTRTMAKDKTPATARKSPAKKTSKTTKDKFGADDLDLDLDENDVDQSAMASTGKTPAKKGQLEKFLIDGLKDLYWAENHLLKALTKMASESTSEELKQAFEDHKTESEDHVSRLEEVFEMLGEKAEGKKCDAIEGIVREVEHMIDETKDDTMTRDAALIIGGQKAEHYEIASYGGLIQVARSLGHDEAADLLEDTLAEEKEADENLTSIAENVVYQHAIME